MPQSCCCCAQSEILQNSYKKLSKMMHGLGVANPAELKGRLGGLLGFLAIIRPILHFLFCFCLFFK
jgi:hypothetical protein